MSNTHKAFFFKPKQVESEPTHQSHAKSICLSSCAAPEFWSRRHEVSSRSKSPSVNIDHASRHSSPRRMKNELEVSIFSKRVQDRKTQKKYRHGRIANVIFSLSIITRFLRTNVHLLYSLSPDWLPALPHWQQYTLPSGYSIHIII